MFRGWQTLRSGASSCGMATWRIFRSIGYSATARMARQTSVTGSSLVVAPTLSAALNPSVCSDARFLSMQHAVGEIAACNALASYASRFGPLWLWWAGVSVYATARMVDSRPSDSFAGPIFQSSCLDLFEATVFQHFSGRHFLRPFKGNKRTTPMTHST